MNKVKLAAITIVIAAAIFGIGWSASVLQRNYDESQARKVEMVQTICTIAHNEIDGTSEDACGLAQDITGTEFLCNREQTACWTEFHHY